MNEDTIRLNKYLALHRAISRREADDYIAEGKVTINGKIATLGARFSEGATILLDGQPLVATAVMQYVAYYKPVGYVCSRKAQGDNQTIYDALPKEFYALKPIGRLDKDSSGLLLLSNDGDFAYRMTHPKFHKAKQYEVLLERELEPLHQQMISDNGLMLEDGRSQLALERLSEDNRKQWRVMMHEGRNRQIRRTFGALGYTVARLRRTNFGPYDIGEMKPGDYITVTAL